MRTTGLFSLGHKRFRADDAVSGVVGAILLLAISVILSGVLWYMSGAFREPPTEYVESGAHGIYTQDGYRISLAGPDSVPLDQGGSLIVTRDGVQTSVPLSSLSSQLGGANVWKVGESVCIVGPVACVFSTGNVIGVSVVVDSNVVFDLPALRYVKPGQAFLTRPNGSVQLLCDMPSVVRILGVSITNGPSGPAIPVTAKLSTTGGPPFSPLNGGNPVWGGEIFDLGTLPTGASLGIEGRANDGSFDQTYNSFSGDPHVLVLKNYDPAPNYPAYGGQQPLEAFLAPYVNTDNQTMVMGNHETVLLFEFNPDLNSSAADFQDLAVLFQFSSNVC